MRWQIVSLLVGNLNRRGSCAGVGLQQTGRRRGVVVEVTGQIAATSSQYHRICTGSEFIN